MCRPQAQLRLAQPPSWISGYKLRSHARFLSSYLIGCCGSREFVQRETRKKKKKKKEEKKKKKKETKTKAKTKENKRKGEERKGKERKEKKRAI